MFIRTKDGIYEVKEKDVDFRDKLYYMVYERKTNEGENITGLIDINQVIKQSDTIEELCDVCIDEEQHYIIKNKELIKDIPNKSELKNHKIYGAIWTDRGLEYVSKLNDKGELELI